METRSRLCLIRLHQSCGRTAPRDHSADIDRHREICSSNGPLSVFVQQLASSIPVQPLPCCGPLNRALEKAAANAASRRSLGTIVFLACAAEAGSLVRRRISRCDGRQIRHRGEKVRQHRTLHRRCPRPVVAVSHVIAKDSINSSPASCQRPDADSRDVASVEGIGKP